MSTLNLSQTVDVRKPPAAGVKLAAVAPDVTTSLAQRVKNFVPNAFETLGNYSKAVAATLGNHRKRVAFTVAVTLAVVGIFGGIVPFAITAGSLTGAGVLIGAAKLGYDRYEKKQAEQDKVKQAEQAELAKPKNQFTQKYKETVEHLKHVAHLYETSPNGQTLGDNSAELDKLETLLTDLLANVVKNKLGDSGIEDEFDLEEAFDTVFEQALEDAGIETGNNAHLDGPDSEDVVRSYAERVKEDVINNVSELIDLDKANEELGEAVKGFDKTIADNSDSATPTTREPVVGPELECAKRTEPLKIIVNREESFALGEVLEQRIERLDREIQGLEAEEQNKKAQYENDRRSVRSTIDAYSDAIDSAEGELISISEKLTEYTTIRAQISSGKNLPEFSSDDESNLRATEQAVDHAQRAFGDKEAQIQLLREQSEAYTPASENLLRESFEELSSIQAQLVAKKQELSDVQTKLRSLSLESRVEGYFNALDALKDAAGREQLLEDEELFVDFPRPFAETDNTASDDTADTNSQPSPNVAPSGVPSLAKQVLARRLVKLIRQKTAKSVSATVSQPVVPQKKEDSLLAKTVRVGGAVALGLTLVAADPKGSELLVSGLRKALDASPIDRLVSAASRSPTFLTAAGAVTGALGKVAANALEVSAIPGMVLRGTSRVLASV